MRNEPAHRIPRAMIQAPPKRRAVGAVDGDRDHVLADERGEVEGALEVGAPLGLAENHDGQVPVDRVRALGELERLVEARREDERLDRIPGRGDARQRLFRVRHRLDPDVVVELARRERGIGIQVDDEDGSRLARHLRGNDRREPRCGRVDGRPWSGVHASIVRAGDQVFQHRPPPLTRLVLPGKRGGLRQCGAR